MMYTGRRLGGEEAFNIGLADVLVARDEVRRAALDLANEIAVSAPLAVLATRATLRAGFAEQVARAMDRESEQQSRLRLTADFREGVAAFAERRMPVFHGR
jgi:enoyl-CoA hydratase/carnithine racemase